MRDVAERSAVQRVWRLHGRIVNKLQNKYTMFVLLRMMCTLRWNDLTAEKHNTQHTTS